MPGFIGVRWGEMVPIPPETNFPDIYRGTSPLSFKQADESTVETTAPDGLPILFVWSFTGVKEVHVVADAMDGPRHYASVDAGATWGPYIPLTVQPRLAMRPDELYGWSDTALRRTVTGGTTWFDIMALPAGYTGFDNIWASSTHLYLSITSTEGPNDLWICGRDGESPTRLTNHLVDGESFQVTGQCDEDAMIGWTGDQFDLFTGALPPKRFVGGSGTDLDLPNVFQEGVPPYDFRSYSGVQFHGDTAILIMTQQVEEVVTAHVYRSTDFGFTWTEVDTYEVPFAGKLPTCDIVYNGETQGAWWHNYGVSGLDMGLKHSVDDGLTWTEVDFGFATPPDIYSAGRPTNHMA